MLHFYKYYCKIIFIEMIGVFNSDYLTIINNNYFVYPMIFTVWIIVIMLIIIICVISMIITRFITESCIITIDNKIERFYYLCNIINTIFNNQSWKSSNIYVSVIYEIIQLHFRNITKLYFILPTLTY